MRSLFSLAAEGIIRDASTNNISVFNILEGITSPAFPLFISKIFYFCLLERNMTEPNDFNFQFVIRNNSTELINMPLQSQFQDAPRNRQIVQIGGIAIPAPGTLSFHLLYGDEEICHYNVQVTQNTIPINLGN